MIGVSHVTGQAASGVPAQLVEFAPELVVTSPGVKPDAPLIAWAGDNEIEVWVDIDLAWRLRDKTSRVAEWTPFKKSNVEGRAGAMIKVSG